MKNYEGQIQVLPTDKICFVKQIYLEDNHFSGVVCYTRLLTNEYKMGERNSEGHDAQGFPYDILDDAILYALQRVYPNAFCKTSMQFCNIELDYNNLWRSQREVYPVEIYIEEMVEEFLPNYSFPVRHPHWVSTLGVELYCIKGVAFDLNKALQYYLYQCNEQEYRQICDLATRTCRPMSQNN